MMKNCLNCEKELTGRQRKYCSKKCGKEYRKFLKMPHIIVDTREQKPLFTEDNYYESKLSVKKLDEGDYSLKDHEECITIERKTLSDWVSCTYGDERDRLVREIKRARNKNFYLMIESNIEDMWKGTFYSNVNTKVIVSSALSFMEKFDWVKTIPVSDRNNAKFTVKKLLEKHKEYCHLDKDKSVKKRSCVYCNSDRKVEFYVPAGSICRSCRKIYRVIHTQINHFYESVVLHNKIKELGELAQTNHYCIWDLIDEVFNTNYFEEMCDGNCNNGVDKD